MDGSSGNNPLNPPSSVAPQQLGLEGFGRNSGEAPEPGQGERTLGSPDENGESTKACASGPEPKILKIGKQPVMNRAQKMMVGRSVPPMLQQYLQIKEQYPQHLLLFQVGDFYEIFFDDARVASEHLNIRLTSRDKDTADPIPMCGVPIHALDNYLPKLLQGGFSCVVMSQVEDAKNKKGMVRREITRIVTPGIRYEGDGLDEKYFNYLAAACVGAGNTGAVSYVDVSTGHLRIQETESIEELIEAIRRISPSEILIPASLFSAEIDSSQSWSKEIKRVSREYSSRVVSRPFQRVSRDSLKKQINEMLRAEDDRSSGRTVSAAIELMSPVGLACLDAILAYIEEVSFGSSPGLSQFTLEEPSNVVFVDAATRRNLELFQTRIDGERKNSLVGHIDCTRTAMGSRLFADWLMSPSCDLKEISARHASVEELASSLSVLSELRELLTGVRDIDRLVSRITGCRATPRDLGALLESLASLPRIEQIIKQLHSPIMESIAGQFDSLEDISGKLQGALADDLPVRVNEGGIFRDGYHEEIDRSRKIRQEGRRWLGHLEAQEKQRTGISGLRIKYNNVFGYFIEVTKTHLSKVPKEYERKQTLVNAERFVTEELKEHELSILSAKTKQFELERELFAELREWVCGEAGRIQLTSRMLSLLDVLSSFAHVAVSFNYCRPSLCEDQELIIRGGRHPVVERVLGPHNFVPNDTYLNGSSRRFAVLTGPNMGGKSTYLRQVGLIQLLAQAGSFVPAESAKLGLVDRIFTRIGAADDLTRGDSTFMVEMREAAVIVRKAGARSLVLIDEIGRGTATTDGLALATAISEWLLDHIGCRTVFATHFHELTKLSEIKEGAFCLAVGVIEKEKEILFTHRIEEKAADRSYGIEVARLAGLPEALLKEAEKILVQLESASETFSGEVSEGEVKPLARDVEICRAENLDRLSTFRDLRDKLRKYNPDAMTPLQALHELIELKEMVDGDVDVRE